MDAEAAPQHLLRCFFLDAESFAEVQVSPEATLPGLLVVVAASFLAGLGGMLWTFVSADHVDYVRFFVRSLLLGSAIQVAVFVLWVTITLLVLQRVHRLQASFGAVFRIMAFGFTPMALQLFIFPPALDQPIGILALGATLVVVSYGLQVTITDTVFEAFTACLAGFVVFCFILGVLGHGQRNLAPGIFALSPNSLSVGLSLPLDLR